MCEFERRMGYNGRKGRDGDKGKENEKNELTFFVSFVRLVSFLLGFMLEGQSPLRLTDLCIVLPKLTLSVSLASLRPKSSASVSTRFQRRTSPEGLFLSSLSLVFAFWVANTFLAQLPLRTRTRNPSTPSRTRQQRRRRSSLEPQWPFVFLLFDPSTRSRSHPNLRRLPSSLPRRSQQPPPPPSTSRVLLLVNSSKLPSVFQLLLGFSSRLETRSQQHVQPGRSLGKDRPFPPPASDGSSPGSLPAAPRNAAALAQLSLEHDFLAVDAFGRTEE